MVNKIKLATVYPEHLNLNGDQANILVLQRRLQLRGVESEVIAVNDNDDLTNYEFIFLGHGSLAAWSHIDAKRPDLIRDVLEACDNGSFIFAVASGYERLSKVRGVSAAKPASHRSEFVDVNGIIGYINTDSALEPFIFDDHALLTLLHGPLLAKNPELADDLISKFGWADTTIRNQRLDEQDRLAKLSRHTAIEH